MFLTLKNEKTLKKMRSKTLKNNIFFILGRNLIIRSFEIPHSIWKLHKDFKSVFVFKFRQKTKKFPPKWQKPLFEKRVTWYTLCTCAPGQLEASKVVTHLNLWLNQNWSEQLIWSSFSNCFCYCSYILVKNLANLTIILYAKGLVKRITCILH